MQSDVCLLLRSRTILWCPIVIGEEIMKEYKQVEIEIIVFEVEDIITGSNDTPIIVDD